MRGAAGLHHRNFAVHIVEYDPMGREPKLAI
jgi:hypothetical protein